MLEKIIITVAGIVFYGSIITIALSPAIAVVVEILN